MEINTQKKGRPLVEELLKRIQDLEDGHARLKKKMSNLMISGDRQTSNLVPPYSAVKLTEAQYLNILQSIDEPIHILNVKARIIYRNRAWENLYGYTDSETLGKAITELVIEPKDASIAVEILQKTIKGESWSGEFPVRNKKGERFLVFGSNKPFHDENGTIIGIICVSIAPYPYQELRPAAPQRIASKKQDHQPLQTAIASKISDLASKVKSKIKTRENKIDHYSNIAPFDYKQQSQSGVFSSSIGDEYDDSSGGRKNRSSIHKVLSSKAEAWMGRKGILWPWKGNGNGSEEDTCDRRRRTSQFSWPWLHYDEEQEGGPQMSYYGASMEVENQSSSGGNINTNDASGSWFSSCGASSSDSITKVDNLDVKILWDDLIIREQIGETESRPTFQETLDDLQVLQNKFATKTTS